MLFFYFNYFFEPGGFGGWLCSVSRPSSRLRRPQCPPTRWPRLLASCLRPAPSRAGPSPVPSRIAASSPRSPACPHGAPRLPAALSVPQASPLPGGSPHRGGPPFSHSPSDSVAPCRGAAACSSPAAGCPSTRCGWGPPRGFSPPLGSTLPGAALGSTPGAAARAPYAASSAPLAPAMPRSASPRCRGATDGSEVTANPTAPGSWLGPLTTSRSPSP